MKQSIQFAVRPLEFDGYEMAGCIAFRDAHKKASDYIECLIEDALKTLEPGMVFEIREGIPTDWGWKKSIAWVHHPALDALEDVELDDKPIYDILGGFVLWCRIRKEA